MAKPSTMAAFYDGRASTISSAWRELGLLFLLVLLIVPLWSSGIVYPLRILVVFFHELSHALAAYATGGRVEHIVVVHQEGGYCLTRGGNGFVILSAGYLGSVIWGGILLVLARRKGAEGWVMGGLGAILAAVAVLWVRPVLGFGFIFALSAGGLCLGAAARLPGWVNGVLIRFVGLTSCFYAIFDIKEDILDRPALRSDAYMLGEMTGLPAAFWGTLWLAAACGAVLAFVWFTARNGTHGRR